MSGESRILIIDDEPAVLRLLETLFKRYHLRTASAESAKEALALLEHEHFDCVITDAVMPEMTGYDLVRKLRTDPRLGNLPVLMLTRKRNRQDVKKAVEAGVTDYVLKPIDEELLLEKVGACIQRAGGRPVSREIPLSGELAAAQVAVGCRILSLGEASLTLRLQYRLEPSVPFELHCRVFSEIGIPQPQLRLESCEMVQAHEAFPDYSWEARVTYAGLSDPDSRKIRDWARRL